METSADRFDTDSDIDVGAELGLGMYGDRVDLSFSNKPVMRYFKLHKKSVMSVELKVTSVLLGEKNDDTHIAEVDFAELIPATKIFGKQGQKKPEPKVAPPPEPSPKEPADEDF